MKKKHYKIVLTAVLCAVVLCGCNESRTKTPVQSEPLDSISSYENSASSEKDSHSVPAPHVIGSVSSSINDLGEPMSTSSSSSTSTSTRQPTSTSSNNSTLTSSSTSKLQSSSISSSSPETTQSAGVLNDYTKKWAYNNITSKQQKVYTRLFESADQLSESCDVSDIGLTVDDLYTAFWAFDYDNPQFLELGSGYSYSYYPGPNGEKDITGISIDYSRTKSEISHSQFDSTVKDVLVKAQSQSSDYAKLKYVHDWLINKTSYYTSDVEYEYIREADGPVIYGEAVCEGYSKAFMYFAQSMGYECVCVMGGAGSVEHMWNMVKLDGQWYHVDVTWDDPIMSDGSQALKYNYFLISDAQIKRDHSIDTPFKIPTASQNYAQQ